MSRENRVSGAFEVEFEPMSDDDDVISRMRVTKRFTGGLTALGCAEMLTVGTAIEDSAAYVAIECVHGVLDGRRGTFILQHSGMQRRGAGSLVVTVVPDSGTDDLLGLRGEFTIENIGAVHTYLFDYVLDPA
jgi:uncharacterized protein DUF3224